MQRTVSLPTGSPRFLVFIAVVGWGLALSLALRPQVQPPAPAIVSAPIEPASAPSPNWAGQQVDALLGQARVALDRGRPQKALHLTARAFLLCQVRDQKPPVACYEVLVEGVGQLEPVEREFAARPVGPRQSDASLVVAGATAQGLRSEPTRFEPVTAPATPVQTSPRGFSLPRPDYPTAPSRLPSGPGPAPLPLPLEEDSGHPCPPPPEETGFRHPPAPPEGRPHPPWDGDSQTRRQRGPKRPPPPGAPPFREDQTRRPAPGREEPPPRHPAPMPSGRPPGY